MHAVLLVPVVLVALVGCAAGAGPGSASGSPAGGGSVPPAASPTGTATPPLSTVPPPTLATPVPPSTPTDLVEPRVVSGRIARAGDCTYLVAGAQRLPLRGDLPRELVDGAQVELLVRPLPQLRDACGEGLVQVIEVRSS